MKPHIDFREASMVTSPFHFSGCLLYRTVSGPAQLALATILQAYTGASDDETIEATLMDRRWQLVLDCLDTEQAPFSKGTLVAFRQRLIEAHMDRRLIERTIEIASQNQEFGSRALRAALDSSPLWGAGRVEDTYNLVGHALKKIMRLVADQQGRGLAFKTLLTNDTENRQGIRLRSDPAQQEWMSTGRNGSGGLCHEGDESEPHQCAPD
jgi:Transposase domain (DUF772)